MQLGAPGCALDILQDRLVHRHAAGQSKEVQQLTRSHKERKDTLARHVVKMAKLAEGKLYKLEKRMQVLQALS